MFTTTDAIELYAAGDRCEERDLEDRNVRATCHAATVTANWFSEQAHALRCLARDGEAQSIREWADEIEGSPEEPGWSRAFCAEVAERWRAVAAAVEAVRARFGGRR